jgi:hypothetical protein
MTKIKEIFERYHVSVTIVGTALVLSTIFGECSYDYDTQEVEVSPDVSGIIEGSKQVIDDVKK